MHPIVLDHKNLIEMLLKNDLILVKRIFQNHIDQLDEDRFFYECEKI